MVVAKTVMVREALYVRGALAVSQLAQSGGSPRGDKGNLARPNLNPHRRSQFVCARTMRSLYIHIRFIPYDSESLIGVMC